MNDADRKELAEYVAPLRSTIQAFVDGETDGEQFDAQFFRLWPDLEGIPSETVFRAAERFFFQVEDHVSDPALRDSPADISTEDLRAMAADFLRLADAGAENSDDPPPAR